MISVSEALEDARNKRNKNMSNPIAKPISKEEAAKLNDTDDAKEFDRIVKEINKSLTAQYRSGGSVTIYSSVFNNVSYKVQTEVVKAFEEEGWTVAYHSDCRNSESWYQFS